jgi:hypothetical protein
LLVKPVSDHTTLSDLNNFCLSIIVKVFDSNPIKFKKLFAIDIDVHFTYDQGSFLPSNHLIQLSNHAEYALQFIEIICFSCSILIDLHCIVCLSTLANSFFKLSNSSSIFNILSFHSVLSLKNNTSFVFVKFSIS